MTEVRGQRSEGGGRVATSLSRGFTLLELLVAMAILLIIVMICAQLFQQARQVVDAGTRRSEMNMKGRAVADFMAQELSLAIRAPAYRKFNTFSVVGSTADFYMLGDATTTVEAGQHVRYTFDDGTAKRNGEELCVGLTMVEFVEDDGIHGADELPSFVDVRVTVSDRGTPPAIRVFESRASMIHRNRYYMD